MESAGGAEAWSGFEPTRRAKLAARTASGRADPTAPGTPVATPTDTPDTKSPVHFSVAQYPAGKASNPAQNQPRPRRWMTRARHLREVPGPKPFETSVERDRSDTVGSQASHSPIARRQDGNTVLSDRDRVLPVGGIAAVRTVHSSSSVLDAISPRVSIGSTARTIPGLSRAWMPRTL